MGITPIVYDPAKVYDLSRHLDQRQRNLLARGLAALAVVNGGWGTITLTLKAGDLVDVQISQAPLKLQAEPDPEPTYRG